MTLPKLLTIALSILVIGVVTLPLKLAMTCLVIALVLLPATFLAFFFQSRFDEGRDIF